MSDYPEIAERFAHDTAAHEMRVMHDDGLYRHLRFLNPGHGSYWFDLITVPGSLMFQGDGDSFVFRRTEDMFAFFRSGIWEDGSLHINPHYWAEKLTSRRDSAMTYDQDLFERQVKEHVAEAIRERTAPRGISRAVKGMLENGDITWEDGARRALEEFEYRLYIASCSTCRDSATFSDDIDASLWCTRHVRNDVRHRTTVTPEEAFRFEDIWEWSFRDYHWWFLWACHAIVWAITRYDAVKTAEQPEPKRLDVLRDAVAEQGGDWTTQRAVDLFDGVITIHRARALLNQLAYEGLLVKHGKLGRLWTPATVEAAS